MTSEETRLKKLKYRAWHRGFREADLILGPFAENHVSSLSPIELDLFELLLDQPDHDIYQWIVGQAPTPPEFDTPVMNRIKQFRYEAHEARGDDHGG